MAIRSIFSYHEWHPCQQLFFFREKGWPRRHSTTRYDFSRLNKVMAKDGDQTRDKSLISLFFGRLVRFMARRNR